jgi:DNA-binding HxlR family transcriptional regulator
MNPPPIELPLDGDTRTEGGTSGPPTEKEDSEPDSGDDGPGLQAFNEENLKDKRDILKPQYLRLLQQILATEWGSLSAPELSHRNEDISESTIRDHLREMANRKRPFVRKLTVDEEQREQNVPWTFYAVTEHGIDLLKAVDAYEGITVLYQMYSRMDSDEISHIEAFAHRPEPDWI